MNRIELLSPAGDLERLKIAILYGADAVYIGGKKFSLRSRASNFDLETIEEAVKFAKEHHARVHVTVNMIPHEDDLIELEEYLKDLERIGVTAIICASLSVVKCAKKVAPKLEVHLSTQHSTTNSKAIEFWKKMGVDRVVLARECDLSEIRSVSESTALPIEVFIHGGMCISYSGRCTLSNHMTNRDANRGGCAQSCRWKYRMLEEETFIHDSKHLFSMSSKDMMAARYIQSLIECGVTSLKIEGRMKSTYYVATVIRAYRMLIDRIYEGNVDEEFMNKILDELSRSENRPTAVGFYEGQPKACDQLYGINGAGVTQEYIASILDYDMETHMATIQVKNHFECGIDVEVFGPTYTMPMKLIECYDEDGNRVNVANKPMQILKMRIDFEVRPYDMIRKVMDKSNRNVY